eukprot:9409173-Alexandrium_andersonii.AAC.1
MDYFFTDPQIPEGSTSSDRSRAELRTTAKFAFSVGRGSTFLRKAQQPPPGRVLYRMRVEKLRVSGHSPLD